MIFLRIFENVLAGQPAEQLDMGPGPCPISDKGGCGDRSLSPLFREP